MKRKTLRNIALALLHSLGFILLFFAIRKLDFGLLKQYLFLFRPWKVVLAMAILLLVYLIKTWRWLRISRSFGVEGGYAELLGFFLFSGLLSTITPGRLGDFSRIYFIRKRYGTGIAVATSSVLLDRIWDVLVLSLAGAASIALITSRFHIEWESLATIVLVFLLALLFILFPGILFRPVMALAGKRPVRNDLENIYHTWKKNRVDFLIPGLGSSLLAFGLLAFLPVLFSADLDAPAGYGTSIAAVSISNILSFLPVTVAGFGTREFVFIRVWSLSSYAPEIAIAVSTVYFVITYLGSMVLGGIAYLSGLKEYYSIREIRERR